MLKHERTVGDTMVKQRRGITPPIATPSREEADAMMTALIFRSVADAAGMIARNAERRHRARTLARAHRAADRALSRMDAHTLRDIGMGPWRAEGTDV